MVYNTAGPEPTLVRICLTGKPVPIPSKPRHQTVPLACAALLAVALVGCMLQPAPFVVCALVAGLVGGSGAALWAARRRYKALAGSLRSQLDERSRAARCAEALARLASAVSAREDPISILHLLARESADTVGLAEAHVLIAPSSLFPDGLTVTTVSPQAGPLGPDAADAPSSLLTRILSSDDWEVTFGPDAHGDHWFAFAISDLRSPIGVLAVRTRRRPGHPADQDALSSDDRELLVRMAGQTGLILENSALFGDVVRRAWEVAGIADVAGAMVTEADLPRLLDLAVQRAATITGAATGAIILVDERRRSWRVEVAYGVHRAQLLGAEAALDAGLPGEVIRDGRPRFTGAPELLSGIVPGTALEDVGAAIFVPLTGKNSGPGKGAAVRESDAPTLGCMVCLTPTGASSFAGKDVRVLTIMADEVAVAVENARLYRRAVRSEQIQHGVLMLVEELRRETTTAGVLAHGCRRAAELLDMHAVVACRRSEGSANPVPAHVHAAGWAHEAYRCSANGEVAPACLAALGDRGTRGLRSDGDLEACPLLRDLEAKSWAGVPLQAQGDASTLVLFVDREDPGRFDSETLQRAELVCSHLGSALEMVHAAETQRQEVEVSNALLSIAHLVATEHDVGRILRTLNEVTLNILGSSTAATFTWDGMDFAGVHGSTAGQAPNPLLHIAGGLQLAEALLERKAPLLVETPRQSSLVPPGLAEQLGDAPALVCPMLSRRGDLLGAMMLRPLHATRRFPPRDVAIALGIARLGALAIDHARLQQQMMHAERMKALGEMSAGVAHDLNNLLAAIMGNAQLALMNAEGGDGDGVSAALQTISGVCLDGAEVIRRIQSMTGRPRDGLADLVDVAEIVRQAVQATRPHWKERPSDRGVQVMLDLEADLLVRGSAADLQEAIAHLVTNAVDAMPDGGRLSLHSLAQHPWAVIEVTDTGTGMEEAVRQRVFDPFFTTKAQRGHGLGLSVAYGIVQQHLGTIAVESVAGRGSTFTIRIPLAAAGTRAPLLSPATPLPKLRVLVVDDESLVADALAGILRCLGHSVDTAPGGEEALAIWQAEHYDLVITDHGMPDMTGTELAQKLKEQTPHVPVLLITGWDAHHHAASHTHQVVDAVLQKPVGREELLRGMAGAIHAAAEAQGTATAACRRVLVVDDNPAINMFMEGALSSAGYAVECHTDADAAVERLDEWSPDLVITDFRLEGMSGADLVRVVKAKAPDMPIIMMTGWRPNADELDGVDLCLDKPVHLQALLDSVAKVMQTDGR